MTVASDAWALALGALPVHEGLRLREAAETRFFPGSDATRFQGLLSVSDLDAFLAGPAARAPRVSLADSSRQGSAGVPYDDYTQDDDDRTVDLPRLLALYDSGATLVLSQMEEVHPPLARFCRGLERVFMHPVQCNVYLTPPGAKGFRVHYDTHDVLILQVQGEKLWRHWPQPPVPFANNRTPHQREPEPQEPPLTQMLRPGDVLYVPRGILHDASSQDAKSSLHLTVGLLDISWADALRAALNILETQEAAFRQSFPTWRLADGGVSDALVDEARARNGKLGEAGTLELVSQQLLANLARGRRPMLSRGLDTPRITATDHLHLSDTVHNVVVPLPDGRAELRWTGDAITLTAQELDWLTRLDEGVSPRELGGAEALAFCQRLASLGLISVQPLAAVKAAE